MSEVDSINIDHKRRRELMDAHVSAIVSYDPETGGTLHTVFEAQ